MNDFEALKDKLTVKEITNKMTTRSIAIIIILLIAISSCDTPTNDTALARYTSPDGSATAIVTHRKHNATSSDTMHVHIQYKFMPIAIEVGWAYYSENINFFWTNNDTLTISNLQKNRYYISGYPLSYFNIIQVEAKDN